MQQEDNDCAKGTTGLFLLQVERRLLDKADIVLAASY